MDGPDNEPDNKVVALKAATNGPLQPIPELIAQIEQLLELAKTGKLRAVGWACVYHANDKPDGEISSGWFKGPYTNFALTSAVELLNYNWKRDQWGQSK